MSFAIEGTLVRAFLENVPDYVFFKDRESRFLAVSTSMVRYYGLSSTSEIVGKTDFELVPGARADRFLSDEVRIMRTGESIVGQLDREERPDGRVTWALTTRMPLRAASGAIIGTFGISKDVTAEKKVEASLENARRDLANASRLAGMAEVATGVLHNVGNVLNSLNVSAAVVRRTLRRSKSASLAGISDLLHGHGEQLGQFLAEDPKGKLVPQYLDSLSRHLAEERAQLLVEAEALRKNIDHIKDIVSMQQAYATMAGAVEPLTADVLMEDSLRMNAAALVRHEVGVVRDFQSVPSVRAERGKVLQILVNLIRNAKYALDEGRAAEKILTLRIHPGSPGRVRFAVEDNGVGIPPENLDRIFSHGFTTRARGHGFGLHSSALAAKEMGGTLSVLSAGRGSGAAFFLELPAADTGDRAA